ncbi:hypothetical protein FEM48_Zijuj04G0092800 [Ziziphus jujuba var. spinosa]|uniref:Carotenoid 9,10(9',10')-cleavage dioxygenase 1-like n=1 Tax=Ziziphus jujuba var. spinosa TaxID=714518 RepID=A0A978VJ15_ZIZJJ|nr:hypothetical protein FEM48_Zijuj04G0092800 [Ziziphus jujuba var. spinosa]
MAAVGVEEKTHENGGGIVVVNPKPNKGVTSKLVDWVETLIVKFMYDPSQPLHYLSGNFAPVPNQTPPTEDLPVSVIRAMETEEKDKGGKRELDFAPLVGIPMNP